MHNLIPYTLHLNPVHPLFRRNDFIFSGTTLFAMERVYLMFTQKAGLRDEEKKGKSITWIFLKKIKAN